MRLTWKIGPLFLLAMSQLALANEQQSAARQAGAASGWSWTSSAGAAVAVTAAIALVVMVRRFYLRRELGLRNDPQHLLRELCQAHGLSRRAERLLRKAAAALGTPHPGRFFLEPQLLLQAEKCEQLRGSRRALGLLYERLFGEEAA